MGLAQFRLLLRNLLRVGAANIEETQPPFNRDSRVTHSMDAYTTLRS